VSAKYRHSQIRVLSSISLVIKVKIQGIHWASTDVKYFGRGLKFLHQQASARFNKLTDVSIHWHLRRLWIECRSFFLLRADLIGQRTSFAHQRCDQVTFLFVRFTENNELAVFAICKRLKPAAVQYDERSSRKSTLLRETCSAKGSKKLPWFEKHSLLLLHTFSAKANEAKKL